MIERRTSQRGVGGTVDWWLAGCWLVLVFIGFLNIYSTVHYEYPEVLVWGSRACKQLVWIGTAVLMAAVILFAVPSRIYENASLPAYVLMFFLLVLVIFISNDTKGSNSWIEIGSVKIQPANVISKMDLHFRSFRDYMIAGAVLLLPMAAIVAENETGSMLVYVGFIFVLYREGISGWWLALLGSIITLFIITLRFGIVPTLLTVFIVASFANDFLRGRKWLWLAINIPLIALMIVWIIFWPKPLYFLLPLMAVQIICYLIFGFLRRDSFRMASAGVIAACMLASFSVDLVFNNVLQEHQRKRIEVLLGMTEDPSGWGYNVHQSKIAIGSGGLFGKGYLNGTQSTFGFVPEQSTDFIFCTIGEEWGFAGSVAVVLLYVFLIFRIIHDAEQCRSRFIRVYGYCVASCFFMHLIINIGMTIGLMPVIGIPLPLVSYGGSSMWGFTILLFIFLALNREERKYF